MKPVGQVVQRGDDAVEHVAGRRRCRHGGSTAPAAGGAGSAVGFGRRRRAGLVERRLEAGVEVLEGLLGLVHGDVAALDQGLGVELAHRAVVLDCSYMSGWV